MKRALTHKQQLVLDFIQRYLGENRRAPIIREIQAGCQITSYKSAIDRLNALERKGYIKRAPNKHRGIRLVQRVLQPITNPALAGSGELSLEMKPGDSIGVPVV